MNKINLFSRVKKQTGISRKVHMLSTVKTVCFQGLSVVPIDVQVQIANGLPAFIIVGLPDKAVAESKERVRGALYALGIALPPKRIVVNLAPADLQKEGSHYDLPIAIALMINLGMIPQDAIEDFIALGELSLDGSLVPVTGGLSAGLYALEKACGIICPQAVGREAAWAGDISVVAPGHLLELIHHIKGTQVLPPPKPAIGREESSPLDLQDVKGQEAGKRVLEIAAAGGHHLLMSGPPGSGKSMLASRLPGLLPPLSARQALEVSVIHSLSGHLKEGRLIQYPPFRNPHHSASMPALLGGGLRTKPGEISLAHHGVLFLDELPEFLPHVLDALRQPLESQEIVIARANAHVTYPAQFQLIAAMNPCKCGYFDDLSRQCSRSPRCAQDYYGRLSGPLLDRIDMELQIPPLTPQAATKAASGETSATVRTRVKAARMRQKKRYEVQNKGRDGDGSTLNAFLKGQDLEAMTCLQGEARTFLDQAASKLGLSMRSYHKVIRVARTIADLTQAEAVHKPHVSEALSYQRINPLRKTAA
jgi:magnesium chelatase family protein